MVCPPVPWGLTKVPHIRHKRIFRYVMDDYQDKLTIVIPETPDHNEGIRY